MAMAARISATAMETACAAASRRDALTGPVAILMPVHHDAGALARTLETLREAAPAFGALVVFLVDDGSEPAIEARDLPKPTDAFRVVLARHVVNLGQGAALETARQLAL